MKKMIILLVLVWAWCTQGMAQRGCGTEFIAPPAWFFESEETTQLSGQPVPSSISVPEFYTLRIFVHFVRNSHGVTGVDITDALQVIPAQLNRNFTNARIRFYLIGYDFIDNDYYYDDFGSKENDKFGELVEVNRRSDAMNIYVLGDTTKWKDVGGRGRLGSTRLVIHGNA